MIPEIKQQNKYQIENELITKKRTFCQNRFEFVEKLGEGSYGKVYKVFDLKTKKIVAIKQIKLHSNNNQGVSQSSLREIAILGQLDHPNIIRMEETIGFMDGTFELSMVFELIDMDLRKFMQIFKGKMTKSMIRTIMLQIVSGVNHMHCNRVLHRDLKPENILISKNGDQVKIADFGLSRTIHQPLRPYSREILSLWYRSPELCMGYKNYSVVMDCWSIGCIFYELVVGQPICKGKTDTEVLFKIFEVFGTPDKKSWDWANKINGFSMTFPVFSGKGLSISKDDLCEDGLDLMQKLLVLNPVNRFTCKQALEHPYLMKSASKA